MDSSASRAVKRSDHTTAMQQTREQSVQHRGAAGRGAVGFSRRVNPERKGPWESVKT